MSKFKIGDKVRLNENYEHYKSGDVFVIEDVHTTGVPDVGGFILGVRGPDKQFNFIFLKRFELAKSPPVAKKESLGKPPLSLIPRAALEAEANALLYGCEKYDKPDENGILRRNFKKGYEWSKAADAALRHIYKFLDGEDTDQESKAHHIGAARANLAMLMYMIDKKVGTDDR